MLDFRSVRLSAALHCVLGEMHGGFRVEGFRVRM